MLTCGVARSEVTNFVPPERRAMSAAVAGVICMRPSAPALEVRPATNRDSA